MIAITPRDIDNTVYVDYRCKIMAPDKFSFMDSKTGNFRTTYYGPIPEEMTDVIENTFMEFLDDHAEPIINPLLAMLDNYNDKTIGGVINTTDMGSINYFLYNIRDIINKSKYYEKIMDYYCDLFNDIDINKVYVYFDHIEFRVYDRSKNDFYIIHTKKNKDPQVVMYKDYCRKHKIKYNKKECKDLEEMLNRNLDKAEDTCGYTKNLVFIVLFKFASTVKDYPMLILNQHGELK